MTTQKQKLPTAEFCDGEILDQIKDSITLLYIHGIITLTEDVKIRRRLNKIVENKTKYYPEMEQPK